MSYHIVEISGYEKTEVFCKDQQCFCKIGETLRQIPLEDVGAILITAPTCKLQSHLIAKASERRIPIIICDGFHPLGFFLPVYRSTDTIITRAQWSKSFVFHGKPLKKKDSEPFPEQLLLWE